ncbi:MAG: hypothetical protein CM15mP130_2340 [Verrucomicrobiota bacterium]|nr:MAG: hypothetical protein CM15mP130_2340 [Verrucomicrobiota bacterium]
MDPLYIPKKRRGETLRRPGVDRIDRVYHHGKNVKVVSAQGSWEKGDIRYRN